MTAQNDWADLATPPNVSKYVSKFDLWDSKFRVLWKPWVYREFYTNKKNDDWKIVVWRGKDEPSSDYFEENAQLGDYGKQLFFVWALPAWDYKQEAVVVLQLKKRSLVNQMYDYSNNKDWWDPTKYDITINKSGSGKETRYSLTPVPPKELSKEIKQEIKNTPINVSVLIDNGDPFKDNWEDLPF